MADYNTTETVVRDPDHERDLDNRTVERRTVVRKGGGGRTVVLLLIIAALVVALLFATGFFTARVTQDGELPSVSVKADAGALPVVDLDSKKVVIGTEPKAVEVPTVETKTTTIDVPVVDVKN
jgi:hypothetical protein